MKRQTTKSAAGFTPRQEAFSIALGWIAAAHRGATGDLADATQAMPPATADHFQRLTPYRLA